MTPLWQLSAAQLAHGYRAGAFTPLDALEACLARTARCQAALNAFVFTDADAARRDAQASGERWRRGAALGPLDGVPVSLKDNLHARGWPTGWGSKSWQGFIATGDELPVARLRAAGAVFFGKTTLPEFAAQGHTFNDVTGITRNPWNTALTPGGSSGGAAAAVAAGCGPLALATDGGGSIRRPASHCGVVGYKPSAGLVPRANGLPEVFLDFEVAGSIARTVDDAAALVGVLAGQALDAAAPDVARILFVPAFSHHPVDPGIALLVRRAAEGFATLGHMINEERPFMLADRVNELWPSLGAAGLARMRGDAAASLDPLFAAVKVLKSELHNLFTRYDAILTPCTAALPWPADTTHPARIAGQDAGPRGHAVFTAMANAAGLPALALPCGTVAGMPAGLQLIGPCGGDATLLALARQFETAHPWAGEWPPV